MQNHHAINGKIHYFYGIFNSYVKLPEGKIIIIGERPHDFS